ncbi:MAG: polyprenyl synthetase family protein [bacterium]|nr:polyprenyl synthetase family protein [bacterium]
MRGSLVKLQTEIEYISRGIEEELLSFFHKLPNDNLTNIIRYHMGWLNKNFMPEDSYKGKRLRPVLCGLICKITGGKLEESYPAGIALELTHNFSLVHDDIQDKDTLRRGRETVWSIWGASQGINVGDAMISLAHKAILDSGLDYYKKCRLIDILDTAIFKLCQGQFMDVDFETRQDVDIEEYLLMIQGKTCSMFEASAEMGAVISEREDLIERLILITRNLGLGFQILDDILGLWGDPKVTGKPVGSDLRQNKKTYPIILGLKERPEIKDIVLDKGKTEKDIECITQLLDKSGIKDACKEKVSLYLSEARKIIKTLSLDKDNLELLLEFTYYLESREK